MKIATVFLVAVTVFNSLFLESSAAPQDVDSYYKKTVKDENAMIDKMHKVVEKNEAKISTDAEKEKLAKVVVFLQEYVTFADNINEKLRNDLKDPKNREKIIIELLAAASKVLLRVLKLRAELTETLKEVAQTLEKAFLGIIGPEAIHYVKLLIKSLPTENSLQTNKAVDETISPSLKSFIEAFLGSVLDKLHANQKAKTAEVENVIEKNMAKSSTNVEKENLAKVKDFVKIYFVPLATKVDKNLMEDVKDPKNRVKIIIELIEAAFDVVLRVLKLEASLKGTQGETVQALESTYMNTVAPGAAFYAGLLAISLPTENSCASQQSLNERMAESEKAVDEIIKRVQNEMDEAKEDEKSGITELHNWLEDFKLLVVATHEKLKEAEQGSSADRDALASELKTIIEEIAVKLVYFVNSNKIPDSLIALLYEYIIIPVRNAACVSDQWSSGSSA